VMVDEPRDLCLVNLSDTPVDERIIDDGVFPTYGEPISIHCGLATCQDREYSFAKKHLVIFI